MIRFVCPHCGQEVEVGDEFAGRKGRCPGCRQVVTIPRTSGEASQPAPTSAAQAEDAAATSGPAQGDAAAQGTGEGAGEAGSGAAKRSLFSPDPNVRGPRRLTLPDSVQTVQLDQPVVRTPAAGRAGAIISLVFSPVPVANAIGIIVGGVSWSVATREGTSGTRRLAATGTMLCALSTLATICLTVALVVAWMQEWGAEMRSTQCSSNLSMAGSQLDTWASSNGDDYPPTLNTAMASYMGWYTNCPETEKTYKYFPGLKKTATGTEILLWDSEPGHGVDTWLTQKPTGRWVRRVDGVVEFLKEEDFQREMAAQRAAHGLPAEKKERTGGP